MLNIVNSNLLIFLEFFLCNQTWVFSEETKRFYTHGGGESRERRVTDVDGVGLSVLSS